MDSASEDIKKASRQYTIYEKLKLSLFKLLDMNYDVTDDSILSKLSSFLVNLNHEKNSVDINLYKTIYGEWLAACITHWKDGNLRPTIAVFSVQVLSIISQDSSYFAVVNSGEENILNQFQELIVSKLATNPLFPISYAKLLTSCISHDLGLTYVLERDLWKQMLSIYVWDESMFVKKECKDFLVLLFVSVSEKNLDDASQIVTQIFELYELYRKDNPIFSQKTINKKYTQILNLLISILETFLMKQELEIANMYFISKPNFCESLWSDLSTPRCDDTLIKISKLLVLSELISFALLKSPACPDDLTSFFEKFLLRILQIFLDKNSLREISLLCELTVKYCKLNKVFVSDLCLLENMFILRLIPLLVVVEKQSLVSTTISDQSIKHLNIPLWESVSDFGIQYQQMVSIHSNLDQIAVCSVTALDAEFEIESPRYRLRIFKVLVSIFQEYFVPKDSESDLFSNTDFINSRLTLALLALLKSAIVKSIEVLSHGVEVYEMLSNIVVFLSIPGQSPALSTQGLNLARHILEILPEDAEEKIISIIKSVMVSLQKVLLKLMYSLSWEVRDSAIEVLSCIADLSLKKVKFDESVISLQLANDVFSVFTADSEYYVRATAVTCLCRLVEMDSVWSKMDQEDVLRKLLDALKTEDEAIVRRQIPLLLKQIHRFSNFSEKTSTEILYPTLLHTSMKDLHWEVCVNALEFWRFVIMKHLQVPATDLSVPHVKSFFVKQLTYLNNLGCFQVMVKCLKNEADLEVSKKAAEILCELSAHLNKFLTLDMEQRVDLYKSLIYQPSENSLPCLSDISIEKRETHESGFSEEEKGNDSRTSDKVIDSIVDSKDISLLASVYKGPESVSAEPVVVSREISASTVLSETELIDMFTKINVLELIENKIEFFRQSQNNLESLLNDILLPGFNNSQNPTLDCY